MEIHGILSSDITSMPTYFSFVRPNVLFDRLVTKTSKNLALLRNT